VYRLSACGTFIAASVKPANAITHRSGTGYRPDAFKEM
jgi:hypothetical protein